MRMPPWTAPLRHMPWLVIAWGTKAAAGLIAGYGAAAIAGGAVGAWPGGDLVLFEDGGLMLSETIRLHATGIRGVGLQAVLLGVAMIPVGLVTSTLLMVSLDEKERESASRVFARCGQHLWPITVAWLVMTSFAAGIGWVFHLGLDAVRASLESSLGARGGDLASMTVNGLAALSLLVATIVHDLVRATIVRKRVGAVDAIAIAFGMAKAHPIGIAVAWWPRAAGALLLAIAGWEVGKRIGSASHGVAATMLAHQAIAFACVALRASWLSRAMDLVEQWAGGRRELPAELQAVMDR